MMFQNSQATARQQSLFCWHYDKAQRHGTQPNKKHLHQEIRRVALA
jgi:hypothetical protein